MHPDDEIDVLTPSHFLIGRHMQALSDHDLSSENLPLLKRWTLCQSIIQHFWTRWSSEYLQQLQKLTKWRTSQDNIKTDDLVLINEDTLVATHWLKGCILQTFPGQDGKVRVATVKTVNGIYRRPITKFVVLLSSEL